MIEKSTKIQLIDVIKQIPMDQMRKKNLILALNKVKEPIPPRELSVFFTLLDLNNVLQNTIDNGYAANQREITQTWRPALLFYKENGLDKQIKLSAEERANLTEIVNDLIDYHQPSKSYSAKQTRQRSKR